MALAERLMVETKDSIDHPQRCRECHTPLESPIGCLHCHTIFPSASPLSHFDRMGLPARFELDLADLERKYLAWSRELHPDYYQTRNADEQSLSLKLSASLNDAYATLKDPFRRAEYLLRLLGGPSASSHRQMPEGFLEGVLELRMEIEEVKESGASVDQLEALAHRLRGFRAEAMTSVGEHFRQLETGEGKPTPERLDPIRERLNTVKYYDGLLRELGTL